MSLTVSRKGFFVLELHSLTFQTYCCTWRNYISRTMTHHLLAQLVFVALFLVLHKSDSHWFKQLRTARLVHIILIVPLRHFHLSHTSSFQFDSLILFTNVQRSIILTNEVPWCCPRIGSLNSGLQPSWHRVSEIYRRGWCHHISINNVTSSVKTSACVLRPLFCLTN